MGWRARVAQLAFLVGFFAAGITVEAAFKYRMSAWWWRLAVTVVAATVGNVVGFGLNAGVRRLTRRDRPESG